ncbi:AAA family ATPase [Aeromonas veronii]|uniref:AAA family ATPase n=1 Tax=Aeromonas veronii TaxID=654 RepID=UPI00226CCE78|nr:AAA family ATPase [Aeromonas veronii]MCX9112654.1 AAA family ATPase [Aeromonas veronii]
MKIKSIKIQAFKSYLDIKDGTFDFSIGDQKTASFISIYAPNGFGKTSFCDAVDFAITKKIHRYSRIKNIEASNKEEIKFNNIQGERQLLIRNKFADKSLKTMVVVEVDNRTEPFVSVYKTPRAGQADYKIECEANKETAFFENAMLYQEAIDSFLRESNAEARFSKFAENDPILLEITNNRSNLITLRKELLKSKKDYDDNLVLIQKSIDELNLKTNDFTTINFHIAELNKCNVDFSLPQFSVNEHFSRDTYDLYSQSLISINKKINWQLSDLKLRQQNFNTHLSNLPQYTALNSERVALTKNISDIEYAISSRAKLEDYETQRANLINKRGVHNKEKDTLIKYKTHIPNYILMDNEKDALVLERSKLVNDLEAVKLKLNLLDSIITNLNNSIIEHKRQIQAAEESIDVSKSHYSEMSSLEEQIKQLDAQIIKVENDKIEQQGELLIQSSYCHNLSSLNITKSISKEQLTFLGSHNLGILISFQEYYLTLQNDLTSLNKRKNDSRELLLQTQSFKGQLKEVLNNVHLIIKGTQQKDCPICSHKYEDFSALEQKLISNPLYNEQEKSILNEISFIENNELKIKALSEKSYQEFYKSLEGIKAQYSKKERELIASVSQISEKHNSLSIERKTRSDRFLKLKEIVNYNSYDEFIANINLVITGHQEKVNKAIKEKHDTESSLIEQNKLLENFKANISKIEVIINQQYFKLSQHQGLIDYIKKSNVVHPNEKSLTTLINNQLLSVENIISSNEIALHELEKKIAELSLTIPISHLDKPISYLEKEKFHCEGKVKLICSQLSEFEFIIASLDVNKNDYYDLHFIHSKLSQEIKNADLAINQKKEYEFHSTVIIDLMEHLVGSEGLSTLEDNLAHQQSKILAAQSLIEELEQDINKLGAFIENAVDIFFKTDLINQLYQCIDPHPEYKNIRFECNTDEKPKLLVKAETANGISCASPMLSFSSAQINVLALSIFLARALHVKDSNGNDVDCIFIDDPVQSIDSINTLSLIDLLRAIVVKFNKQIIVTTHDENFHSLLKRKMPSTIFPSKYLRLVSFGKVAVDSM